MDYSGGAIEVDYMGPLSQAQKKLFKSTGIRSGLEALMPLAGIHPEVIDVIDPTETARILLEASGFPSKALRDDEEIQEVREMKERLAAMREQIAQGVEIAKAVPAAGKAPEEGSPLALLTEDAGL